MFGLGVVLGLLLQIAYHSVGSPGLVEAIHDAAAYSGIRRNT